MTRYITHLTFKKLMKWTKVQIEQDREVDDLTTIWPLPMLQRYHIRTQIMRSITHESVNYSLHINPGRQMCLILADNTFMVATNLLYPDLCRYIQFVKKNFRPVLSKEAEEIISSYYRLQRRSSTHNAGISWEILRGSRDASLVLTWGEGSWL